MEDAEKYSEQYVAKLKNEFEQQLEQKNQRIHELQRDLSRATAVERDYIQEIELLQNVDKTECKKLLEKIQGYEEICHALRENRKEDLTMLESDLNAKCEENRLLIEKNENLQRIADNLNVNAEIQKMVAENVILRNKIESLENDSANMREAFEEFQNEYNCMQMELNSKSAEAADLKENYAVKSEEFKNTNQENEALKDEIVVMKAELDILKHKPVDHVAQGNSLFAEVNDRRVQLQQNMTIMKEHYKEMKGQHTTLLQQVNTLQSNNVILAHKMKRDVEEVEQLYCMEIGFCKQRIKILEEIIEKHNASDKKRPELPEFTTFQEMEDYFRDLVKTKDDEIENLMRKLDMESMSGMTLFNNLRTCKRELADSKLAVQQSLNENSQLRTDIELMKLNDPELRKPCQECAKRKPRFALPQSKYSSSNTPKEVPEVKQNKMSVGDFLKKLKEKRENKENESPANEKHVKNETELSASASNNDVITATEDKENKDTSSSEKLVPADKKGVRFTEDTVDPKTDKKHYRPRGKILTCPITYVTSKKKQ